MEVCPVPGCSGLMPDALPALVCFQIVPNCSRSLRLAWDRTESLQIALAQLSSLQIGGARASSLQIALACSRSLQIVAGRSRSFQSVPGRCNCAPIAPDQPKSCQVFSGRACARSLWIALVRCGWLSILPNRSGSLQLSWDRSRAFQDAANASRLRQSTLDRSRPIRVTPSCSTSLS